jgi:hypothetical protein
MHVENINYEYKNGLLVQLNIADIINISYSIDWMKQEIKDGNFPSGHMLETLKLLEWLVKETEG